MFRLYIFAPISLGVLVFIPLVSIAAGPTKLVLTTEPQTIATGASSSVIILQLQDDSGQAATSTETLHVNSASSSATGRFSSASITTNSCGSGSNIYFSKGTSNKGLCYWDSAPGTYELSFNIIEASGVLPAAQNIFITSIETATSTPTTTEPIIQTPTSTPPTTTPQDTGQSPPEQSQNNPGGGQPQQPASAPVFSKTGAIKISEILPNPAGEDDGGEKIELQNTGSLAMNLEGWYLDDRSDTGVKSRAYQLPLLSIAAGAYAAITLPKGSFVLNNSGGDMVNLYYPDKTLADSVAYSGTAQENLSYQKVGGAWVWAGLTFGAENFRTNETTKSNTQVSFFKILLNEFLPNPAGQDEGKEWVELFNPNAFPVSLKGFILDDSGGGGPGTSAWVLPESAVVGAGGYLRLTIPEDKFSLSNSGQDSLRLFAPDKSLSEAVNYKEAPEEQSYQKGENGQWSFGWPTPGEKNLGEPAEFNLIISEILPNPTDDQDEFVEIYNPGSKEVSLDGFALQIGARKKVFSGPTVSAGGYLAIVEDELPGHLSNSGQTLVFFDNLGRKITELAYGKAQSGLSYATDNGLDYLWTGDVTPGAHNDFVLGAATAGQEAVPETPSSDTASKTSAAPLTKTQAQTLLSAAEALQTRLAVIQNSFAQLQTRLESQPKIAVSANNADEPFKNQKNGSWFESLGLLAGAVLVSAVTAWLVFKVVKF